METTKNKGKDKYKESHFYRTTRALALSSPLSSASPRRSLPPSPSPRISAQLLGRYHPITVTPVPHSSFAIFAFDNWSDSRCTPSFSRTPITLFLAHSAGHRTTTPSLGPGEATAGLRALGSETSEQILQEVRELLQHKSSLMFEPDRTLEGAFQWAPDEGSAPALSQGARPSSSASHDAQQLADHSNRSPN
ncbi:uncharacterized protein LOC141826518 [Curcuma longa]|uniref:uncharacterized protein LOC141826518 n=1 Tax=Curcuma longa TaxID=136217 RepID=UPI003D9FA8CC